MKDLKRVNSELVWNLVGILAAIALLLYLADSLFGFGPGPLIPVSGGERPAISLPTAALVTPQPPSPTLPLVETEPADAGESASPAAGDAPTSVLSTATEPFPQTVYGYGPDGLFILHRLQEGESYTFLAGLYGTSVEALEALNYQKEGKRLWVGQYVVVIPGLLEPPLDMPQFIVLQIDELTSLADIAREYGLLVEALREYNLLAADVDQIGMRLLLVPILGE